MLNKPYPIPDKSRYVFFSSLIIGVASYLFIIVFQPFGTSNWHHPHKYLLLLTYAIIPPIAFMLEYYIYTGKLKDEKSWTIKKELIKLVLILCTCSILSYLYNMLLFPRAFVFADFLYMFLIVFSTSILIFANYIFINYILLSRKYSKLNKLNSHDENNGNSITAKQDKKSIVYPKVNIIDFFSESNKTELSIELDDFLFADTADNYINIHFKEQENIKNKLIRNTVKNAIEQINHPAIVRCHRSYIVNLNNVQSIKGNAQGYRLYISKLNEYVPVSRSYIPKVIPQLKEFLLDK